MYRNARSRVKLKGFFGHNFLVLGGLHQGSVLSPMLIITCEERYLGKSGRPEELLYTDALLLVCEPLEGF